MGMEVGKVKPRRRGVSSGHEDTEKSRLEFGPQPITDLMAKHSLSPHNLVESSPHQLTHKMVSKACKGRRLTPHVKKKVLQALVLATGTTYTLKDAFNY